MGSIWFGADLLDEDLTDYDEEAEQALIAKCLNGDVITPDGFYNSWDGACYTPTLRKKPVSWRERVAAKDAQDAADDQKQYDGFDWDAFEKWSNAQFILQQRLDHTG